MADAEHQPAACTSDDVRAAVPAAASAAAPLASGKDAPRAPHNAESGAGGTSDTPGADESKWCLPASSGELQKYDAEAGSVRLMGDPVLRQRSAEVDPTDTAVAAARHTLQATLRGFRKKFGFGRGISAVQIGFPLRMIALNLGDERGEFVIHNPVITWKSEETFTMYDDCMSFPDLLVRVRRHKSISVSYLDEEGKEQSMERVPQALAELLQHEIDHCDGVLSVDRALGSDAVIYRTLYDANKAHFDSMVDYFIVPTV